MCSADSNNVGQLEVTEASVANVGDVAQMGESETIVVRYREPDGRPSVRVDGYGGEATARDDEIVDFSRIVIDNLPAPDFPVKRVSVSLPDCALKNVVHGFKRLGQYGDSNGKTVYHKKRRNHEEVENRDYRVRFNYTVMIRRKDDIGKYELTIMLMRNGAGEAQWRSKPKSNFVRMEDSQISGFVRTFTTDAVVKLRKIINGEYEYAQALGVDPDYYNLPSLTSE